MKEELIWKNSRKVKISLADIIKVCPEKLLICTVYTIPIQIPFLRWQNFDTIVFNYYILFSLFYESKINGLDVRNGSHVFSKDLLFLVEVRSRISLYKRCFWQRIIIIHEIIYLYLYQYANLDIDLLIILIRSTSCFHPWSMIDPS